MIKRNPSHMKKNIFMDIYNQKQVESDPAFITKRASTFEKPKDEIKAYGKYAQKILHQSPRTDSFIAGRLRQFERFKLKKKAL